MNDFYEEQRFSQWWLYAIIFAVIGGMLVEIFSQTQGFIRITENWPLLLVFIITTLLLLGILAMKLKTSIGVTGIKVEFSPFPFFVRTYSWEEIEKCYVKKYSPISDYGGWGVRGLGTAKAYSTSGNMGIMIIPKNSSPFLIGTQKPEKAKRTLTKLVNRRN